MSVRLLIISFLTAVAIPVWANDAPMSSEQKIAHLYQRLTYGQIPSDLAQWKGLNAQNVDSKIKAWVELQLNPEKIDDHELESELKAFPVLSMTPAQAHEHYKRLNEYLTDMTPEQLERANDETKKKLREKIGEGRLAEDMVRQMVSQRNLRALRSHRQLQEVLFDFWYNHFNVDITKGQGRWLVPSYERDAIRKNIFGHFDTLLKATISV